MSATQMKSRPRLMNSRHAQRAVPKRSVEELLLDLTYRMHATRVVRVLPAAGSPTARN